MSFTLLGILNSQAAGGGAGAYDLLETTILTSPASSVTFSGLDAYSDYKHLQIRATVSQTDNQHHYKMYVNGDTTAGKYRSHYLFGNGSSVSSDATTIPYFEIYYGSPRLGGSYPNSAGALVTDILDFSNTSKNTTIRSIAGFHQDTNLGQGLSLNSGAWFDTAAVTSFSLKPTQTGNWTTNCRFSLYGVK